jgi:hypothetical protein
MFIARWTIDVRFGHKDAFTAHLKKWHKEIGESLGWKIRVVTGSIGANESRFEMELPTETLDGLDKAWAKMSASEAHKRLGRECEPLVVSGTNRWEVLRIVDMQ